MNSVSFVIKFSQISRLNGRNIADDSLFINGLGIGTTGKVVYLDATTGNVSIRASFRFTGDASATVDGISAKTLFLDGIEQEWTVDFGTWGVSAYAREGTKGTKVNIQDKSGRANVNTFGTVTMYTKDNSISNYGAANFKWEAAHEFGHVLGLPDLYIKKTSLPTPDVTSIMNGYWTGVQESDITNLLKKHKLKK